jgi:hypothetical protein
LPSWKVDALPKECALRDLEPFEVPLCRLRSDELKLAQDPAEESGFPAGWMWEISDGARTRTALHQWGLTFDASVGSCILHPPGLAMRMARPQRRGEGIGMAHRQTVAQTPDRGWKPLPVRPRGRLISTVQVRVGVSRSSVAEGNCVVARRGGEQPEANCRSAG